MRRKLLIALVGSLAFLGVVVAMQPAERKFIKYQQPPEGAMRVLWFGNSHALTHEIPLLVQELAEEAGHRPIYVALHASGGQDLERHMKDPLVAKSLEEPWDLIVAQEQSWRSVTSLWWSRKHLTTLAEKTGAPVLFYQVWSYTDAVEEFDGALRTPARVQAHIDRLACTIDTMEGVDVAPVGHHIHAARERGEPVVSADGNHLAPAGAALAARVLANKITEGLVEGPDGMEEWCASMPERQASWKLHGKTWVTGWTRRGRARGALIETEDGLIAVDVDDLPWEEVRAEARWLGRPVTDVVHTKWPSTPDGIDAARWGVSEDLGIGALPPEGKLAGLAYKAHRVPDLRRGSAALVIEFPDDLWVLDPLLYSHVHMASADLAAWRAVLAKAKEIQLEAGRGYGVREQVKWMDVLLEGIQVKRAEGASRAVVRDWASTLDPPGGAEVDAFYMMLGVEDALREKEASERGGVEQR